MNRIYNYLTRAEVSFSELHPIAYNIGGFFIFIGFISTLILTVCIFGA